MILACVCYELFSDSFKWLVISMFYQAAVYGRDPNWGRIACAAGYAGIPFDSSALRLALGDILLMDRGQPLPFDR